jgi:predicted GNAT family N-acyltransferase
MGIIIRAPKTELEWENYFDLRYRILREPLGQPVGSERNKDDATGIHFALYENDILKAVARLDTQENEVMQVRFVAVENESQGKGYGKKIMLASEEKAKSLGTKKMILHARENAVPFYLNLNYRLIEKSYNLFDQVQHYLMMKEMSLVKSFSQ